MSVGSFYDPKNIDKSADNLLIRLDKDNKIHFEEKAQHPVMRFFQKVKMFFSPQYQIEKKILPFVAKKISQLNAEGKSPNENVEPVLKKVNEICNSYISKKEQKHSDDPRYRQDRFRVAFTLFKDKIEDMDKAKKQLASTFEFLDKEQFIKEFTSLAKKCDGEQKEKLKEWIYASSKRIMNKKDHDKFFDFFEKIANDGKVITQRDIRRLENNAKTSQLVFRIRELDEKEFTDNMKALLSFAEGDKDVLAQIKKRAQELGVELSKRAEEYEEQESESDEEYTLQQDFSELLERPSNQNTAESIIDALPEVSLDENDLEKTKTILHGVWNDPTSDKATLLPSYEKLFIDEGIPEEVKQEIAPDFVRFLVQVAQEEKPVGADFSSILESVRVSLSSLSEDEKKNIGKYIQKVWSELLPFQKKEVFTKYFDFLLENTAWIDPDIFLFEGYSEESQKIPESFIIRYLDLAWKRIEGKRLTGEEQKRIGLSLNSIFKSERKLQTTEDIKKYIEFLRGSVALHEGLEQIRKGEYLLGVITLQKLYTSDPSSQELIIKKLEELFLKSSPKALAALGNGFIEGGWLDMAEKIEKLSVSGQEMTQLRARMALVRADYKAVATLAERLEDKLLAHKYLVYANTLQSIKNSQLDVESVVAAGDVFKENTIDFTLALRKIIEDVHARLRDNFEKQPTFKNINKYYDFISLYKDQISITESEVDHVHRMYEDLLMQTETTLPPVEKYDSALLYDPNVIEKLAEREYEDVVPVILARLKAEDKTKRDEIVGYITTRGRELNLLPVLGLAFIENEFSDEAKKLVKEVEETSGIDDSEKQIFIATYYRHQKDFKLALTYLQSPGREIERLKKEITSDLSKQEKIHRDIDRLLQKYNDTKNVTDGIAVCRYIMENKALILPFYIEQLKSLIDDFKDNSAALETRLLYLIEHAPSLNLNEIAKKLLEVKDPHELFDRLMKRIKDDKNIDEEISFARAFVALQALDLAVQVVNTLGSRWPKSDELLLLQTEIYSGVGEYHKAKNCVQILLQNTPHNIEAITLNDKIDKKLGVQVDEAKTQQKIQEAVLFFGEKEKSKLQAALPLVQAGEKAMQDKYSEAVALYLEALNIYPESAEARIGLALLYGKDASISLPIAIDYLEKAKEISNGKLSDELEKYLTALRAKKSGQSKEEIGRKFAQLEQFFSREIRGVEQEPTLSQPSDDIKKKAELLAEELKKIKREET
jgi:hypothetical protein